MTNKKKAGLLIFMALFISPLILADEKAQAIAEKELALSALTKMSTYLRSLGAFHLQANVFTDEVLDSGQKIQQTRQIKIIADIPTKLKATESSIDRTREFYFDGENFTIYTPQLNYYASFQAPGTIANLITKAGDTYDIDIPLSDLFFWGENDESLPEIDEAIVIGVERVKGVSCNYFAFRQKEIDWQICIQRGNNPLPLKLIVTSKLEATQPQYVAILQWDTAPMLSGQDYSFVPDQDDHKVKFAPVKTNN